MEGLPFLDYGISADTSVDDMIDAFLSTVGTVLQPAQVRQWTKLSAAMVLLMWAQTTQSGTGMRSKPTRASFTVHGKLGLIQK